MPGPVRLEGGNVGVSDLEDLDLVPDLPDEIIEHFAAMKVMYDEEFRDEYRRLILDLLRFRNKAFSDELPSEWYSRWWKLALPMRELLSETP